MTASTQHTVTVRLAQPLTKMADAHKVLESVLGKLGCGACLSGFDIRFTHARDFVVNPASLAVNEIER